MKIEAALTAIKEKFEIAGKSKIFEVKTGLFDRGFEGVSLILYEENGEAYINDGAQVANGIGCDLNESELKTIAKAFGFYLEDWHIVKKIESVHDIESFIALYMHIQANYDK